MFTYHICWLPLSSACTCVTRQSLYYGKKCQDPDSSVPSTLHHIRMQTAGKECIFAVFQPCLHSDTRICSIGIGMSDLHVSSSKRKNFFHMPQPDHKFDRMCHSKSVATSHQKFKNTIASSIVTSDTKKGLKWCTKTTVATMALASD